MPAAPRTTRETTTLLILWFAFLNTQLLLAVVSFFLWRALSPGVSLQSAVYWDSALLADPMGLVLVTVTAASWSIGVFLPVGPREPVPVKRFLVRFILIEAVGILGFLHGFLRQNPLLAVPFLALATVGMLLQGLALKRLRPPSAPKA